MRTTVTLDSDVDALLKEFIQERDLSFKEGINQALRRGLVDGRDRAVEHTRTFDMGIKPGVDLNGAPHLAAEMEDMEIMKLMRPRPSGHAEAQPRVRRARR